MASTPTKLMTFEEFEQLPWPDSARYELRHGELICLPPAKYGHMKVQEILRRLLDEAAAGAGIVYIEFGFRPRNEREYRIADVAFATNERLAPTNDEGYFEGAPDLVVEVLSPSNTRVNVADKKAICLENGCREFWVVDLQRRQIEFSTPDGRSVTYKPGDEIPLFFGGTIAVDAIFAKRK